MAKELSELAEKIACAGHVYASAVGEAYFTMAEEAAECVLDMADRKALCGLRGEELQLAVDALITEAVHGLCRAEGAGAVDADGNVLPSAADSTKAYLYERLETLLDVGGWKWELAGEFDPEDADSRKLVYVG